MQSRLFRLNARFPFTLVVLGAACGSSGERAVAPQGTAAVPSAPEGSAGTAGTASEAPPAPALSGVRPTKSQEPGAAEPSGGPTAPPSVPLNGALDAEPGAATPGGAPQDSPETPADGDAAPPPLGSSLDPIPAESEALLPWLQAESYRGWPAESAIHPSAGPHFGNVRTWVHPALLASLEQPATSHPMGAAAVKELYGGGDQRTGWAVAVKVAQDSAGGLGWYWYEISGATTYADSTGASLCFGCHSEGNDFILTEVPLQ